GEVIGPDRTGEAVFDLIDLRQHRLLVAPFEYREHRPKDFLLADAHVHGHVGKNGRLDEQALGELWVARPRAAAKEPRAVLLACFDIAHDAVVLDAADDRAHGR